MPLIVNTHFVPTTVYHIPGPNKHAPLFYMIPGNPGLSEFYETFLEELRKLHPEFEYICPSHIGFDTLTQASYGLNEGNKSHTLDEQIEHKISLLKELVRDSLTNSVDAAPEEKKRDVVLMGHSVGSWMVQRIAVAFADSDTINIKLVCLATPTVKDIALSERGSKLLNFGKYTSDPAYYVSRISQLITWTMPDSFIRYGLRYIMGDPPEVALNATTSLITKPRIIKQALDMGKEEMVRIGSEFEPEDIKGFWAGTTKEGEPSRYKIWMYFVKEDHWINENTRKELIDKYGSLPHVETRVEDGDNIIAHAFCVKDNEHVAQLVAAQLEDVGFKRPPQPASMETGDVGRTEVRAVDVDDGRRA